jgi:hypothetical protein
MGLDAGWAAVLGAAVGSAGPVLLYWVQNKRANSLAEKRRQRLRELLSDPQYQWRSMATLSASIGASDETTAELLIEMDARTWEKDRRSWGLISRNPNAQ